MAVLPPGQEAAGGLHWADGTGTRSARKFRGRRKPPIYEIWQYGPQPCDGGTAAPASRPGIQ